MSVSFVRGLAIILGVLALSFGAGSWALADDEPMEGEAAQAAPAEEATAQEPERRPSNTIEEIMVTARKREENLLKTPVSVTAFSRADLQDQGFTSIVDIGARIPNIKLTHSGDPAGQDTMIYMRGVGQNNFIITLNPGIATYLDGFYIPRMQGSLLELADMERVEVLRGPQGTLFGMNTIGGAISVITKKPSFDGFEVDATARVGNYGMFETDIAANIPLIDELAAVRFSFASKYSDGWAKNKAPGQGNFNDRKYIGGRMALRVTPTEYLTIDVTAERTKSHQSPSHIECNYFGGSDLTDWFNLAARDPFAQEKACRGSEESDKRSTSQERRENDLGTKGATLSVEWDINENHTLTFRSGLRQLWGGRRLDLDATELSSFSLDIDDWFWSLQNEVQWNGMALDGRLTWVAGLYQGREKAKNPSTLELATPFFTDTQEMIDLAQEWHDTGVPFESIPWGPTFIGVPGADGHPGHTDTEIFGFFSDDPATCAILEFGPAPCLNFGSTAGLLQAGFITDLGSLRRDEVINLSYAAYGQFTYDITERLHFSAGLRRSQEKKEFDTDVSTLFLGIPTLSAHERERFSNWSPMANLKYDLTDDSIVYFTWSRGWKSGGFNGGAFIPEQLEAFQEEDEKSMELGYKGTFFDNRLRLSLAGFFNLYDDIQITQLGAFTDEFGTTTIAETVFNAAEGYIQGVEVELEARPTPELALSFIGGLTNARYKEFVDATPDGEVADFKNNSFIHVPPYTYTVSAAYTLRAGDLGDLTPRVEWNAVGRYYSDIDNNLKTDDYGLLRARMSLELADGKTRIAVFGDNLLNRDYKTERADFLCCGYTWTYWNRPRTYGVEVSRVFN